MTLVFLTLRLDTIAIMNQSFCSRCRTDFSIKVIDFFGIQVKLQIWDVTDGCDIDLFSVPVFSRFDGRKLQQFAAAIIFVYDVSDAESLHKVKQNILDCARNFESDGCAKVLVGNKRDLLYGRVIGSAEAQALAAEHGMMYFETSAKTPACWDAVEAGQVEASCAIRPMDATKWKSHMSSKSSRHEKLVTELTSEASRRRAARGSTEAIAGRKSSADRLSVHSATTPSTWRMGGKLGQGAASQARSPG